MTFIRCCQLAALPLTVTAMCSGSRGSLVTPCRPRLTPPGHVSGSTRVPSSRPTSNTGPGNNTVYSDIDADLK